MGVPKSCDVSLVTFFGDVIMMTSLKWRQNWFVKDRFCHNQFEKKTHNLAKSRNFRLPTSKTKGAERSKRFTI